MEDVTKNMNDLFAAAKTAKVNYPINNIAAIVNTAPLAGAAGGVSSFFNLSNILIMIGSIVTIATVAIVFSGAPNKATESNINQSNLNQLNIVTAQKEKRTTPEKRNAPIYVNSYEEIAFQEPVVFEASAADSNIEVNEDPELVINGIIEEDSPSITAASNGFDSFHSVTLNISADVNIVEGKTANIEVSARGEIEEMIAFSIENGVLTISVKDGYKKAYARQSYNADIEIELTMSELRNITINGSGDVVCKDDLEADHLKIDINGSGDVALDQIVPNKLDINLNGSGDISMYGEGTTATGVINLNGSGDVCTKSMNIDNLEININGSGDVAVTCEKTMEVSIIGSGDVCYSGSPTTNISTLGSGEVNNCGHY